MFSCVEMASESVVEDTLDFVFCSIEVELGEADGVALGSVDEGGNSSEVSTGGVKF